MIPNHRESEQKHKSSCIHALTWWKPRELTRLVLGPSGLGGKGAKVHTDQRYPTCDSHPKSFPPRPLTRPLPHPGGPTWCMVHNGCMCEYICIHIYIYTVFMSTSPCTHIQLCTHISIRLYIENYVCVYIYRYICYADMYCGPRIQRHCSCFETHGFRRVHIPYTKQLNKPSMDWAVTPCSHNSFIRRW